MDNNDILKRVTDYGEALSCDICGETVCAVHACDLEGSYFVCMKCMDGTQHESS